MDSRRSMTPSWALSSGRSGKAPPAAGARGSAHDGGLGGPEAAGPLTGWFPLVRRSGRVLVAAPPSLDDATPSGHPLSPARSAFPGTRLLHRAAGDEGLGVTRRPPPRSATAEFVK